MQKHSQAVVAASGVNTLNQKRVNKMLEQFVNIFRKERQNNAEYIFVQIKFVDFD